MINKKLHILAALGLSTLCLAGCHKEEIPVESTPVTTIEVETTSTPEPTVAPTTEKEPEAETETTKSGLSGLDLSNVETKAPVPTEATKSESEGEEEEISTNKEGEYVWEYPTEKEAYNLDFDKATLFDGFELFIPVGMNERLYHDGWNTYQRDMDNSYLRAQYIEDEDGAPYDKIVETLIKTFSLNYSDYETKYYDAKSGTITCLKFTSQQMNMERYSAVMPFNNGFVYIELSTTYQSDLDFGRILEMISRN